MTEMLLRFDFIRRQLGCLLLGFWLISSGAPLVFADDVLLKNGLTLRGNAFAVGGINVQTARLNNPQANEPGDRPVTMFYLVDDGVRRYFILKRQVAELIPEAELSRPISFKLEHQRNARSSGFGVLGAFKSIQPFDQFGRREVVLGVSGREFRVLQEITELRPDVARVQSSRYAWDFCLDTKTLSPELIREIIQRNSNRDDPKEWQAAIQFYLQAEMFSEAQRELTQLTARFPELEQWAERPKQEIAELQARRGLYEVQRRRAAGQHQLAYYIARQFPADDVSADVMREAQEVVRDYEQAQADGDQAMMLLDMLQAELPMEQADRLRSLRMTLINELKYETLPRLSPFLQAADDPSLTPSQKLALAYSGWLLGENHASEDLDDTIRLWEGRFLALEYLRNRDNPVRDAELLEKLKSVEGISVDRLARMIPQLPLPQEAHELTPGEAGVITLKAPEGHTPVAYTVILPPEYSEQHRYPVLVVLRGEGRTFEDAAEWWAGSGDQPGWAQRRGYIVIAPHYCSNVATEYNGNEFEHEVVLKSIHDARQRFQIDSDRIFLTGHGMGGNACFDMAMSHPGVFAGAIPFTGMCERACIFYWQNDPALSWYVVGGERDRDALDKNAPTLNHMMRSLQDVTYCDYKARGYEGYHEEQARIFEWMQTCRRAPLSQFTKFEAKSMRTSENEFFWLRMSQLPDAMYPQIQWDGPQKKLPKVVKGNITPGGTIFVDNPGKGTAILLSPDIFNFDNRCKVRVNTARNAYDDFVTPTLEAMLSELRERGDRQRLVWARIDL